MKGNTYAPVGTLPDLEEAADASPMFQKPPQVLGSESPVMPVTGYLRSESPVAHHEISNEPPMTVSDLGYEGQRQVGSRAAHPNDTPSVESIPPKVKREVMWNLNGYNDPDLFRRPGQLPPPNSAVYPGLNDSSGPLPSGWDDPDLVRPDNHVGSLFAPFLNLVGIETPRVGEAVNKAKPGKNNTVPEQHPAVGSRAFFGSAAGCLALTSRTLIPGTASSASSTLASSAWTDGVATHRSRGIWTDYCTPARNVSATQTR